MNRTETNEAIEQLAPPAPPCFDSRLQWLQWLYAAADAHRTQESTGRSPLVFKEGQPVRFNFDISYCEDCDVRFRSAMLKEGRCNPTHLLPARRLVIA